VISCPNVCEDTGRELRKQNLAEITAAEKVFLL